jgi:hypothetical protein
LTALVNAAAARPTPEVYVVEDAHWIDKFSESLLADFLAVVPQTRSLVLVTYRPEYHGSLSGAPGAQTIGLAALDATETKALVAELLGHDPSVTSLLALISDRVAGTPSSPRRLFATFLIAVSSPAAEAHMPLWATSPTSRCLPRCKRRSRHASTVWTHRPSAR